MNIMRFVKEIEEIQLLEDQGEYYLQYDAGGHMIKKKRIKISEDEAEICRYDENEMYNLILQYQNSGIYGEDM